MALIPFLLSFFSVSAYARTIKVFCELQNAATANFTLAASLDVDDQSSAVITDVLVSFREKDTEIPSQIVNTKGYYRSLADKVGYTYLFPVQNRSDILHFILRINAGADHLSEVETKNQKYMSSCTTVE